MKKILTLLFLLTAYVSTASATKLYIENGDNNNWTDIDVYAWENSNTSNNNGWNTDHATLSTEELYGTTWYVFEMTNNWDRAIVRGNYSNREIIKTGDLEVTSDLYITVSGGQGSVAVYGRTYTFPVFRGDLDNNWDSNDANATAENAFTFYREYTKSTIDTWASANSRSNFNFRFKAGYSNPASYWPQAYPDGTSTALGIGSTLVSSYENETSTGNSWQVTIPSYNYEKIRLTAAYRKIDGDWKWQISADAYISKSIGEAGYATFGSDANVDFSKAIPTTEGKSFVAKKGKVGEGGIITYYEMGKNDIPTTLYGGEGALLEGDADTYSIPVAASATADLTHNDFKAIDSKALIPQHDGAIYHYILTTQTTEGDGPLGFYKVNTNGSWCAANTAYLATSASPGSARDYFPLWDDVAPVESIVKGVENTNLPVYDLQGRCVANPQKGLYIVNGKKVVIK